MARNIKLTVFDSLCKFFLDSLQDFYSKSKGREQFTVSRDFIPFFCFNSGFFLLLGFPRLSTSCMRPYLERATASHRCGVCSRAVDGAGDRDGVPVRYPAPCYLNSDKVFLLLSD